MGSPVLRAFVFMAHSVRIVYLWRRVLQDWRGQGLTAAPASVSGSAIQTGSRPAIAGAPAERGPASRRTP
jgi:hypothetical protein